jgi:hypothetical protein
MKLSSPKAKRKWDWIPFSTTSIENELSRPNASHSFYHFVVAAKPIQSAWFPIAEQAFSNAGKFPRYVD